MIVITIDRFNIVEYIATYENALWSADAGKAILVRIVSMLAGLIRSTSGSRVYENSPDYCAESEWLQCDGDYD